ncbi:MAG TPA: GH25 family lysozyme [Ktedonobacteraceae bacterium]|nr:GH25 family lysozyme [Ktedonobacteraceae bacterium]
MLKAQRRLQKSVWLVLPVLFCLLSASTLLYTGIVWPNNFFVAHDSVQGLDVSNHQHHIDWKSVAQTGKYTFVFIKATEGSGYKDAYFQENWRDTKEQGLIRGAYHFYTASLSGEEQANNYISVVPKEAGMLPPVLDLEVSGKDRTGMLREIHVFLDHLEHYYGMKPIIYTDADEYAEYVRGNFADYPVWIRNVLTPPQQSDVTNWTFWQYNDRGHVPGITEWVDLNVFSGNQETFNQFVQRSVS